MLFREELKNYKMFSLSRRKSEGSQLPPGGRILILEGYSV